MNNFKKILAVGLLSACLPAVSHALSPTVNANATFITPLSNGAITHANFGYLAAATAGTYVLDTTGAVTPSAGGVTVGGTPAAASFSISGSASQTIDIAITFGAAVSGVTASLPRCDYDGGGEAACASRTGLAAPGAGKTLLIGLQIVADGATQPDSTTPISIPIPVTITYS